MEPADLLVQTDRLQSMSAGLPVIAQGEVAVRDGRILHAGAARPADHWQAKRVIPGTGRAVLPGFVNCHSHAALVVFRAQMDDFSAGLGLQRIAFRMENADVLPCREALRLATMGSAQALGLDLEIGSLEPCRKADLIMVDLQKPHLQPCYGGYPSPVFYAKASDVVTGVVDAQVVLEEGRPVGLDLPSILAEITRRRTGWRRQLRALGSVTVSDGDCACCG
jgi:cytosine/adenosine deaminase-related metal-dependent hydrolase